jgi:glycosyltransferase involved in cell wall biosynthesis
MVRDEADIIEGTLRHMADEVDHLIVADNLSSDGTRDILDTLAKDLPLTVVDDPDPGYTQSAKMSALAERAAVEQRASWIVPFDAEDDPRWLRSPRRRGPSLQPLPLRRRP